MFKKVVSLLVMTVAVSSQMANADIARAPSATPAVKAHGDVSGGAYPEVNTPRLARSVELGGAEFGNELLSRDAGLRSIASSYAHGAHSVDDMDGWLMLLVGGGLVVLQLRRKQKTLPQRPLFESENKLYWG